jgi:hypothetical protein
MPLDDNEDQPYQSPQMERMTPLNKSTTSEDPYKSEEFFNDEEELVDQNSFITESESKPASQSDHAKFAQLKTVQELKDEHKKEQQNLNQDLPSFGT